MNRKKSILSIPSDFLILGKSISDYRQDIESAYGRDFPLIKGSDDLHSLVDIVLLNDYSNLLKKRLKRLTEKDKEKYLKFIHQVHSTPVVATIQAELDQLSKISDEIKKKRGIVAEIDFQQLFSFSLDLPKMEALLETLFLYAAVNRFSRLSLRSIYHYESEYIVEVQEKQEAYFCIVGIS